jgi:hypothetical protein
VRDLKDKPQRRREDCRRVRRVLAEDGGFPSEKELADLRSDCLILGRTK